VRDYDPLNNLVTHKWAGHSRAPIHHHVREGAHTHAAFPPRTKNPVPAHVHSWGIFNIRARNTAHTPQDANNRKK
jgi:hypothetical protein